MAEESVQLNKHCLTCWSNSSFLIKIVNMHYCYFPAQTPLIIAKSSIDSMNQLSYTDLHCYLFGKAPVRPIKIDELKQKVIEYRNSKGTCTIQGIWILIYCFHDVHWFHDVNCCSLLCIKAKVNLSHFIFQGRKTTQKYPGLLLNLIKKNLPDGITENNTRLSRALESFPREVQLCTSSVPCVVYGVCARQHIPIGTWIGPYEGEHCQLKSTSLIAEENIYMWEVRKITNLWS